MILIGNNGLTSICASGRHGQRVYVALFALFLGLVLIIAISFPFLHVAMINF
jgi:hypothetical protein